MLDGCQTALGKQRGTRPDEICTLHVMLGMEHALCPIPSNTATSVGTVMTVNNLPRKKLVCGRVWTSEKGWYAMAVELDASSE